jgi:hypothetical protein
LVADEPNLSGLIVRFGTFRRTNRSKLKLAITRLRTGERKSIVLAAKDLVDNEFITLRFAAFPNATGEVFEVKASSAAGEQNCVALYVTSQDALEAKPIYGVVVLDD